MPTSMAPAGNSGNYFANQNRSAERIGGTTVYSFAPRHGWGTHDFKVGADVAGSSENGLVNKHPVDLVDSAGRLVERIAFTPGVGFNIDDTGMSFFGQDHWQVNSRLAVDLGIRSESQEITDSFRIAPRVGISWEAWPSTGTVVNAGYGWFYDRVPLNIVRVCLLSL